MSIEAPKVVEILNTIGATTTGGIFTPQGWPLKFMASIAGTGAVTSTVLVEVTNTPSVAASWVRGVTFTLSGTTTDVAQYVTPANWAACRAKTTAISGAGATVIVTMGY